MSNQSLEGLAVPCADASLLGLSYACCMPSQGSSFLGSGQLLTNMWSLLCIVLSRMSRVWLWCMLQTTLHLAPVMMTAHPCWLGLPDFRVPFVDSPHP